MLIVSCLFSTGSGFLWQGTLFVIHDRLLSPSMATDTLVTGPPIRRHGNELNSYIVSCSAPGLRILCQGTLFVIPDRLLSPSMATDTPATESEGPAQV